jgi:hypothetical protein
MSGSTALADLGESPCSFKGGPLAQQVIHNLLMTLKSCLMKRSHFMTWHMINPGPPLHQELDDLEMTSLGGSTQGRHSFDSEMVDVCTSWKEVMNNLKITSKRSLTKGESRWPCWAAIIIGAAP